MLGEAISRAGAVRQKAYDRRAGTLGFENLNLSAGRPKQLGFENGLQTPAVSTEVNGARQKLALPCQRVAHHGWQVVEMRLPLSKERARSEAAALWRRR